MRQLRQFQESLGLTQRQLARFLGISESYLSEIMAGKAGPSKKLALKISQKTGIPVLNLLYPEARDEAR